MRNFLIAAAAVTALSTGTASAADMAARPYVKAPPIVDVYNWTGFYIGGNVGYGFSGNERTVDLVDGAGAVFSVLPGVAPDGIFGGGQIGYNWQFAPNWVFGVEADIQGGDLRSSITYPPIGGTASRSSEHNINYFGTVRGRLGYAFDKSLIYVTGGYAYGDVEYTVHNITNAFLYRHSSVQSGYVVGGGWEYMFLPNWTGKIEYQYIDLGSVDLERNPLLTGPGVRGRDARTDLHTVRLGLNYKFGGPVVAKY